MKKLIICATLLSGCSLLQQKPELAPNYCEPTPIIHAAPVSAVTLRSVEFYVVSEKNLDEFLAKAGNEPFFAITPKGYENLSHNVQELRRYIKESQSVILFYRSIHER